MPFRASHAVLITSAALAACVAGIVLYRATSSRRAGLAYAESSYREGVAQFARLPYVPIATIESPEAMHAVIAAADVTREGTVAADVSPILRRTSEFFYYRFAQSSPDRYRAWRSRLGDRPRTLDEMIRIDGLRDTYTALTGHALASDANADSCFRELWACSLRYGGGFNQPVGIAAEPAGISVVIGRWTASDRTRRSVHGRLSADVWRGVTAANMRSWWHPRLTADDIIRRDGSAGFAEVGVVVKYADGTHRPLVLGFVHDSRAGDRVLLHVTTYNFASGSPLSPMEY